MTSNNANASFVRRIGIVVATMGAAQVVLLTQVPVISDFCGLGVATIGGLVALGTLCFMIAGPFWGALSDRRGRKSVVLAGLGGALGAQGLFVVLLVLVAWSVLATVPGIILLGASRLLYGLSAAGVYPACQAWAVEGGGPERRLASLSDLSAAANLGRVLGPLLVFPLLAAGAMWPLAWLVLLPLLGLALAASVPSTPVTVAETGRRLPLDTRLVALFAVALLGTAAIGQLQVMLGPVLTDYYSLGTQAASSGTAVLLLGVALVGFLVQWGIVRRLGAPALSLLGGATLLAAGVVVLWFALGTPVAALGLALVVAGMAGLVPGYTALASRDTPDSRRGRLFGLLTLMHTGGYTLGFAAGGWVYEHLHRAPLTGVALCVVLLAGAAALALRSPAARSTDAFAESA